MDDKTQALIRQLLTALGMVAATMGVISAEQAATLTNELITAIGAGMTIWSIIWSLIKAHQAKKVAVAADAAGIDVAQVKAAPLAAAAAIGSTATAVAVRSAVDAAGKQ